MAVDTFIAYVGVYDRVADADSDYELIKELHTRENLIDAYDAAVVERADGRLLQLDSEHRDIVVATLLIGRLAQHVLADRLNLTGRGGERVE